VFRTGWHVPFGTPCAARLAGTFILNRSPTELESSCSARLTRPPFKI
jgi:hypothetical protein